MTFWPAKIITLQNLSIGEKAFEEALSLMFIQYIQIEESGEPLFFSSDYVYLHSKHHILFSDMTRVYSSMFLPVLVVCIVLKYPLHT